jgi:hypothetical protein
MGLVPACPSGPERIIPAFGAFLMPVLPAGVNPTILR